MTTPEEEQIKELRRVLAEIQTRAFDKEAAYRSPKHSHPLKGIGEGG